MSSSATAAVRNFAALETPSPRVNFGTGFTPLPSACFRNATCLVSCPPTTCANWRSSPDSPADFSPAS